MRLNIILRGVELIFVIYHWLIFQRNLLWICYGWRCNRLELSWKPFWIEFCPRCQKYRRLIQFVKIQHYFEHFIFSNQNLVFHNNLSIIFCFSFEIIQSLFVLISIFMFSSTHRVLVTDIIDVELWKVTFLIKTLLAKLKLVNCLSNTLTLFLCMQICHQDTFQ